MLEESGQNEVLIEYMAEALQRHHVSPEGLQRYQKLIFSLKIENLPLPSQSIYPKNDNTQKGNFAEIFLAEYLGATTEAQLPVYRLRYNTNLDQSMKGDDVLLFDLDSNPVRIIVGESKFRGTPTKSAVIDIVNQLVRSNKKELPISLQFVANRLFEENKKELGEKIQHCSILFAKNKLDINYVGLLISNHNAKNHINNHTSNSLNNLLMISLGVKNPERMVKEAFDKLEERI